MDRNRFALVALLVLLTRLPFLLPGHGTDPDAWRAAHAAGVIADTGRYEASRFPGNPVHEFANALLIRGGPLATNAATALASALAAGFFALILRRLGSRDDLLGGLALASAPAIAVAGVQTLDYAWALAFAMAALYAAMGGRALTAGALVGLAIGCRISSVLWLVPVTAALGGPAARLRAVLAAAALGTLAFVPVYGTYGPGFFRFYQTGYPGPALLAKHLTVDLWGIPGTAALGIAALAALRHRRRGASALPRADAWLAGSWCLALAVALAAWLRLPVKAFYLIPAVPLVLLLAARFSGRPAFVLLALALIASPWTLKVVQEDRIEGPPSTTGVVSLRPLGVPLLLDARGPLLVERARRVQRSAYVDRVLERARRIEEESVVVSWDWLPEIRVRLAGKQAGAVRFTYLLPRAELDSLRRAGVRLHSLAGVEWENEHTHGVRLSEHGVTPLLE